MQTITLINSSFNPTTGVANVQVLANGKNVYTSYKNVLNAPALWKAFNTVTGGIIGILTVTANDGFNGFAVALDPTDPDYPAALGGSSISLVVPSALAAANIVGFENSAPLVEAPDVALQSNAASSGAITKNTTNNVLYVGKLSSGINETPSAIASTITGTFVAGDATNFKLYASATGVLDGTQTLIATVAATGLASGAVPSFANTASYPAGTKYFILTTDVPNAAVSGHTFIASKLAYTGLAGTVYDTQAATGGTKTVS